MEGMCDNDLGNNLGIDEEHLTHLFKTIFRPGSVDTHQRSLVCQYSLEALPIRVNLYKHDYTINETTSSR